ncbi:hypothetical protein CRUP_002828, partial [Coryphaenoides rupestris]
MQIQDPLHWCFDPELRRLSPADDRTPTPPPSPSPSPSAPTAGQHGSTPSLQDDDDDDHDDDHLCTTLARNQHVASGPLGVRCSNGGRSGGKAAVVVSSELGEGSSLGGGAGEGGYFGFMLAKELASRGRNVVLLTYRSPRPTFRREAVFYKGDIRDYGALSRACEGVECVFHTASYGMSGPEQVSEGSINVAFTGQPIEDGDEESRPCVPLHMYLDHYSRTKSIADQMVRAANGSWLKGGGHLRSCVLRSSGIYGPGEKKHFHRMMAKMNWVHVDNLVMAHMLAAEALTAERHGVAYKMFGHRRPMVHLPVSLVYLIATILEYLHLALRPIAETPLLFTRNEIDKARRELGFCPKKHDLAESVEQYVRSQPLPSSSDPQGLSLHRMPHTFVVPLLFLLMLG